MYQVEIVMPVYNESGCIDNVIRDWIKVLDGLHLHYRLLVLNDGSQDNSAEVMKNYEAHPGIKVITKRNSGHGPTILMGYQIAVEEAKWVFQTDSDGEIEAQHFRYLWAQKNGFDAVIGVRDGRQQPASRKIMSFIARQVVALFYGSGVNDVNCPFRLLRSEALKPLLQFIPHNTFAPNIAISGILLHQGKGVCNVPVMHTGRKTGAASIKKWRLLKAAIKSLSVNNNCLSKYN